MKLRPILGFILTVVVLFTAVAFVGIGMYSMTYTAWDMKLMGFGLFIVGVLTIVMSVHRGLFQYGGVDVIQLTSNQK